MATEMTPAEVALRSELSAAFIRGRRALRRVPELSTVSADRLTEVAASVDQANAALRDAESYGKALGELEAVTTEGMLLSASASMAITAIRELLTLVCAEVDARRAA